MTQGSRSAGQITQLKKAFLQDFAQTGNISESSANVGIERKTVYNWKEHDNEFLVGFGEAEIKATECLETEARRRAVDGVMRLKFDKGVAIIDPRTNEPYLEAEKSDTLLIFLLKARNPAKYRDRYDGAPEGQQPVKAVDQAAYEAL
jgi:hypothetical protein